MNSNRKLLAIHALLLVVGSFAAVNQIRCSEVDALKNITSDINELAQTSPELCGQKFIEHFNTATKAKQPEVIQSLINGTRGTKWAYKYLFEDEKISTAERINTAVQLFKAGAQLNRKNLDQLMKICTDDSAWLRLVHLQHKDLQERKTVDLRHDYLHLACKNGKNDPHGTWAAAALRMFQKQGYTRHDNLVEAASNPGPAWTNVARQMIDTRKTDINDRSPYGDNDTVLHAILQREAVNCETLKLIVPLVDINAINKTKSTPLHMALGYGHFDAAQLLIECGANVNTANQNGLTPLHLAAEKGNKKIIEILLAKGADASILSKEGRSVISYALANNNVELAKFFAAHTPTALISTEKGNGTEEPLLITGAYRASITFMEQALQLNNDINQRSPDTNQSALHVLAESSIYGNHIKEMSFLLSKGIDTNLQDNTGETALMKVLKNGLLGHRERAMILDLLLKHGALVKKANKKGETPLHILAIGHGKYNREDRPWEDRQRAEYITLFIKQGADPSLKDKDGKTALDYALEYYRDKSVINALQQPAATK